MVLLRPCSLSLTSAGRRSEIEEASTLERIVCCHATRSLGWRKHARKQPFSGRHRGLPRQNRIAMVGLSRDPASFSAQLFKKLVRRGYDVVPVNPKITNVFGRRCFARVQDIEPPVNAALLLTSPEVTDTVVNDCAEAGIHRVWMHRATETGSVGKKAVQFCEKHGIRVVAGECPFMFLPEWRGSPPARAFPQNHGALSKVRPRLSRAAAQGNVRRRDTRRRQTVRRHRPALLLELARP